MLKIDLSARRMDQLSEEALRSAKIRERDDIQDLITRNPEAFFKELGQDLFLLGSEIRPADNVDDRIDLLALDPDGTAVVIELKRDSHKLHLLQAIPYAGMIARWEGQRFLSVLSSERRESLTEFLEVSTDQINQNQRIVLIAEDYDWEVLIAAEWLSENFEVDIRCVRLRMAVDGSNDSRYLSCTQLYPTAELEDYALSRGRQRTSNTQGGLQDWNTLIDTYENPELVSFVREWISRGDKALFRSQRLVFPSHPEKWRVNLSKNYARVMQSGRFKLDGESDEDFWKRGLSQPESVEVHRQGIRLHFTLKSKDDFEFFLKSIAGTLKDVQLKDAVPAHGPSLGSPQT